MWTKEQIGTLSGILRRAGHNEPARVIRVLASLAAGFGEKAMTFDRAAIYAEDLGDLDPSALEAACVELRRSCRFMPTIAEIRGLVAETALKSAGVSCSAEDAWTEVLRKVRSIGTGRLPGRDTEHGPSVVFDDPVTNEIMDATWWRTLGQATNDQLPSERRAFIDRYKAALARVRFDAQTGRQLLPGAHRMALPAAGEA